MTNVQNTQRVSKIMKCPNCICNNCIIRIKDYRTHFFQCVHRCQIIPKTFDEYEESQAIPYRRIVCNSCARNQEELSGDFTKCLQCSDRNGYATYYCHEHSQTHPHPTILYDHKYYYCTAHYKSNNLFISYCKNCQMNLCDECEKSNIHKSHNIFKFSDNMIKDIEPIKKTLEVINNQIIDLELKVEQIVNHMNRAINIFKKYHFIALDILGKYEKYNLNTKFINYQVIKTIDFLNESNISISDDLKKLIQYGENSDNWDKICKKLITMHQNNIKDFASIDKSIVVENEEKKNHTEDKEEPNQAPGKNQRSISNNPQ